ncbi:hypothetical protein GU90_17040 [Saccharopolyspora rectivirgula]|uniref:Uncharacterized protein n=2 Tax=Saccharopolyspora rectivirgula TaxID=28042 RepID=A0A073AUH8_9PSEU|nr:hypothetical protein GU90_17040 [Saccharopolyspora rectivirgula]
MMRSTVPAHIAFMTIPAHGHINPGLGLVRELVSRGHRVTCPTTEEFGPKVRRTGAEPVFHTSVLPSPSSPNQKWPEELPAVQELFLRETERVVAQLEEAYAGDRPDLILYDIAAFQAPVLAHRWGVPYLQLSPTHVAFEGIEQQFDVQATPELAKVQAEYDAYLARQGVELDFTALTTPPRCIVTIPRSFQYRADTVSDACTFVGPLLTEPEEPWQRPDDRPVLLISMGSAYTKVPEFYRTCLAAFGGLDWHVVMSIGRMVDPAELGEIPDNVEIHPWVPQRAVLAQADLFITHAGMGGICEALSHGVPMVAAPQAAEQFANAARLEELGLGRQVDSGSVSPEQLRETALAVHADPAVHRRLRAVRQEIAEAGGLQRAVEIVESMLPAAG